jgi:PBP1b-binding outer membrane lipoprotein LpoB
MKKILLIIFSAVGLSGCSDSPPSCSDSDATDLVTEIITGQLDKKRQGFIRLNSANKKITYEVEVKDIRTASQDNNTGKFKCEATVNVISNNAFFNNGSEITYTTEITEDGGEPYVTVYGFSQ